MYHSIELFEKPRKLILSKIGMPEEEPEMSEFESAFLCGMLKTFKPHKILEIGVAGGTTAIIFQCMELIGGFYEMYSVDLREDFYRNDEKKAGYLIEEAKKHISNVNHKLFLGKYAPECMKDIGGEIDCLILDTIHALPGELLEFIVLLPYLKDGAIVIMHDVANNYYATDNGGHRYYRESYATKILLDSVVGDKYLVKDPSAGARGEFPNIAGFRVITDTRKYIANCISALTMTWYMIPSEKEILLYRSCIKDSYDEECLWLFDSAVEINKAINNAKPISLRCFGRIMNALKMLLRGYC